MTPFRSSFVHQSATGPCVDYRQLIYWMTTQSYFFESLELFMSREEQRMSGTACFWAAIQSFVDLSNMPDLSNSYYFDFASASGAFAENTETSSDGSLN